MSAQPDVQSDALQQERRRRHRSPLHCPILLFPRNGEVLRTTTENLSIDGFYCFVPLPFVQGEALGCRISIVPPSISSLREGITIVCRCTVARIDPVSPNRYGLAGRIDDYRIAPEYRGITGSP
jgi:hypothetical protein